MSLIPTYAIPDSLPPPVISGTTVQSFTDVWGDVWIAKNGVYGGAWKRARDTLYGKWYRNAAFTLPAGQAAVPLDSTTRDPYSMYTNPAGSAAYPPISGLYDILWQVTANATASGQWVQPRFFINGMLMGVSQSYASSVNAFSSVISQQFVLHVGDYIQFYDNASTALAAGVGAPGYWTYATVEYYGTG
jgi:hypothetical protein